MLLPKGVTGDAFTCSMLIPSRGELNMSHRMTVPLTTTTASAPWSSHGVDRGS